MSIPVDRPGQFRGTIREYGLTDASKTSAVGIAIRANLTEIWNHESKSWEPWEYDMEAEGTLWIVKADGSLNPSAAKSLIEHAGWSGDLESVISETWQPIPCQFAIEADNYNNVTRFRIAFVNDYNRVPGAMNRVDPAKAKAIALKHGSALRAIAGMASRPTSPDASRPNGAPTPPPPPPGSGFPPVKTGVAPPSNPADDSNNVIPF